MKNKIFVSWKQYDVMISKLVEKIQKDKIKFDGVYGIPRGGLPLAVCLSHRLKLPLMLYPTKKTLVVDDISDGGNQLHPFRDRYIATLYSTEWTRTPPDIYLEKKKSVDDWLIFPWEN